MRNAVAACLATVVLAALSTAALAAEPDAEAMAKMMELMSPGKEHAALAKRVGTWDAVVKAYMDPSQPAEESKGTATFTAELGGRYLKQEFTSTMMEMPFTGIGYDGYDRLRNVYTSVWMDSLNTATMLTTGTSTDGGKTIEYTGEMGDCMAAGKTMKIRMVTTTTSDDAFGFVMYQTRDGKEAKALEVQYTRAKAK